MKMRFFWIPGKGGEAAEVELNRFLGQHRIVEVERQFSQEGSGWAVCVEYLDEKPAAVASTKPSVDYRETLEPAIFEVFSGLRRWRKALAEEQSVPVYAIASNEQLAIMATKVPKSMADLEAIPGFGPGRLKNFGESLLAFLSTENAGEAS